MRRSYKNQVQKSAVVASALVGKSKRQIAKDLGMSRPTVDVILKEANFDQIVAEAKYNTYALLNDATDACKWQLRKKHNAHVGLELLKGVGILRSENPTVEATVQVIVMNGTHRPTIDASLAEDPQA